MIRVFIVIVVVTTATAVHEVDGDGAIIVATTTTVATIATIAPCAIQLRTDATSNTGHHHSDGDHLDRYICSTAGIVITTSGT